MLDWQNWSGRVAGIISLAGYLPLIIAILLRQARPNRASWLIWSMANILTLVSYYASGARSTAWVPLCYAICTPIVVLLAFVRSGEGGWNPFDRWCLVISALSGIVWWILKTPIITLLVNMAITYVGALPTIRKAYRNPKSENKLAWLLFFSGCVLNTLAVKDWRFIIFIYPLLGALVNGVVDSLLYWPRRTMAGAHD